MEISFRKTLEAHGAFESEAQACTRARVLAQLSSLFLNWCPEGHTLTMGSYMLGVVFEDTDIDIICVAPPDVPRHAFNTRFYRILKGTPNVAFCSGVCTCISLLIQVHHKTKYIQKITVANWP